MCIFFSCKENYQNTNQSTDQNGFVKKIQDLKEAKIDSLIIGKKDSIKSKYLISEAPIITYKYSDADTAKNNYIFVDGNSVFYPLDILKITDKYILLLLKQDTGIRAVTYKLNGEPIESILISDTAGNNEWKAERHYKYFPEKNEFILTDIKTDTEWIVFPTSGKDIVSYKKESKIGIDNSGRFLLISQKDSELKS
jgi:hypothetical protein